MPATVNGIGTHYYGRKNASARRGHCEFCGRLTNLTSFDTRECFCVLFIPLIPMTKYRILDQCASCRKHKRLPLAQFQADLQAACEPLRAAVRANRANAEAHDQLVRQLVSFGLLNDADTAAREAVQAIPQDAALQRLAGQILSMKGDLAGAQSFLDRAVQLDGSDSAARTSLGRVYYFQRKYNEAARELEEARRLAPEDASIQSLIAETYFQAQRWQDALAAYQRIAGPAPDKATLRRIADCKKKIGYELTPAERKASRRWWPFGGGSKPATIKPADAGAARDFRPKVILVLFGGLIAVGIVGALLVGYYKSRSVDVYFDSVYPKTTFEIDGETFTPDTMPLHRSISPGPHNVVVRDKKGTQLEKKSVNVEAHSAIDSIFENRAYVYNTQALRVYRRASLVYASNESDRGYSAELVAGEPWFEVKGVDYIFSAAPEEVELSSSSSSATKTEFNIAPMSISAYGIWKLREGKAEDAEKAFRIAMNADPCDMYARRSLAGVQLSRKEFDDSIKTAHGGIEQCKANNIDAHRIYQDTQRHAGNLAQMLDEYRAARDAHPGSAPYHYLFGRLLDDPNAAIAEQRAALQIDPNFGWAHAALAYELLGSGAYDESMREFAESLKTNDHDENTLVYYAYAAVGANHSVEARQLVDPTQDAKSDNDWSAKWIVALAQKNWPVAKQMWTKTLKGNEDDTGVWMAGVQLAKFSDDAALLAKQRAHGEATKALKTASISEKVEDAMEHGMWTTAADHAKELGDDAYVTQLYGAAGLMLADDTKGGNDLLNAILTRVHDDKQVDADGQALMNNLASAMTNGDEAKVVSAVRTADITQLKHAYFFLAVRAFAHHDIKHAKEMFRRSTDASFDLSFPRLAAQRMAEKL